MREIKFRAWDYQNDEMVYEVGITPDSDFFIPYKISDPGESFDNFDYYPESKLMQFTGLRDNRGKEIYEGDLIKITDPFINQEAIGVAEVVFSYDYDGGWVVGSVDIHLNIGTRTHMVNVVGNIYENPELLDGDPT